MTGVDYLKLYDLENYLLGEVAEKFKAEGKLDAFDFFCIVIWKANRAKSRVARLLLKRFSSLDEAVEALTTALNKEQDRKAKMKLLISDWGFNLPMASAILTVLYQHDFTVYDIRVCNVLGNFHKTKERSDFDQMWSEYESYVAAVKAAASTISDLRNKDRWLWGKSFSEQLKSDISTSFKSVLRESALCWIRDQPIGHKFTYSDVYKFLELTYVDECASRGKEEYREDAKRAVKDDAAKKHKIVRKVGNARFERIAPPD
jgi:hypothetical protein